MAKFLNTSATNYFLEELIKDAKERLILISPFLKLNARNADPAPVCPKCGATMVLRTSKRGRYQGQQLLGRSQLSQMPQHHSHRDTSLTRVCEG